MLIIRLAPGVHVASGTVEALPSFVSRRRSIYFSVPVIIQFPPITPASRLQHSTTPAPPYSTESAPQKYKFKHSFVTSSPTKSNPNSDRHGRKTTTYRSAQSPASHLTCPTGHARHQIHKSQRLRPYSPGSASPSSIKLSHASLSDTVLLTQSVAQLRRSHSSCLPQTGQTITQFSPSNRHGDNFLPPHSTLKVQIPASTVVLLNPRCTAS